MTHDMADKTTHVDIVQNPDIKSFLDECNYMHSNCSSVLQSLLFPICKVSSIP